MSILNILELIPIYLCIGYGVINAYVYFFGVPENIADVGSVFLLWPVWLMLLIIFIPVLLIDKAFPRFFPYFGMLVISKERWLKINEEREIEFSKFLAEEARIRMLKGDITSEDLNKTTKV